jgi:hypothetical protein
MSDLTQIRMYLKPHIKQWGDDEFGWLGGGVTDHGALTGLGDDDHPQYALDTDLSGHVAAADPHVGYQKESEKDIANGYAGLDASGLVPDARIPSGIARDSEVSAAVTAHEGAADPHIGYQKESEKGVASGYASLDGSTLVPTAQQGTGTPDTTVFLRGDRTWAAPTATADPVTPYAMGTKTVSTGNFVNMARRLILTGAQLVTVQGDGCLRIN